jgi:hypothetical protein
MRHNEHFAASIARVNGVDPSFVRNPSGRQMLGRQIDNATPALYGDLA